jgi:hypothetical protein
MLIHDMEQRSAEWFAIKCGRFSASDFGDLMPSSRQGMDDWNKTQLGIIYRVAAERLTGLTASTFTSYAMQHGIDTEDTARIAYEMETGNMVRQVGFVEYSDWIGCSPDGLIGDYGGLEIKCPNSDTHLRYLFNPDELEADYYWQCMGGMLCTGRLWWELYSFDDRFPDPDMQSVVRRINFDQDAIDKLDNRLEAAIYEAGTFMGRR